MRKTFINHGKCEKLGSSHVNILLIGVGGHSIRGSTGDKTWSLIVMIKFITLCMGMWKYVHDTTISETVIKSEASEIQQAVDQLTTKTSADKFQLNETKCKEFHVTFSHSRKNFDPINVNGQDLECMKHSKILGLPQNLYKACY